MALPSNQDVLGDTDSARRAFISPDYYSGKVKTYTPEEIVEYENTQLLKLRREAIKLVEHVLEEFLVIQQEFNVSIEIISVENLQTSIDLTYLIAWPISDKVSQRLADIKQRHPKIHFTRTFSFNLSKTLGEHS